MRRTWNAVALAVLIGLVVVGGSAMFLLEIDAGPALLWGLVAGAVLGGLVYAAAARAGTFDEVTPPKPRHPGPPDRAAAEDTDTTPSAEE